MAKLKLLALHLIRCDFWNNYIDLWAEISTFIFTIIALDNLTWIHCDVENNFSDFSIHFIWSVLPFMEFNPIAHMHFTFDLSVCMENKCRDETPKTSAYCDH